MNVALPLECRAKRAVLDGEIVCLDKRGNSQFRDLLFRRSEPRFYAFDLLFCNGEDLRYLPPYLPDQTRWLKIRNTGYSQWIGREKLFETGTRYRPELALLERVCSGV